MLLYLRGSGTKSLQCFTTEDPTSKQRLPEDGLTRPGFYYIPWTNKQFSDGPKTGPKWSKRGSKSQTADAWRLADDRWAKLLDA